MLHSNDNIYIGGTLIIVGTIYYIHDTTNVVDIANVVDTFTFLNKISSAGAIDHFPTWHLTNYKASTIPPTDSCAS